jgi:TetR/AcrR family fatty acid metabolism transcriptional regulator
MSGDSFRPFNGCIAAEIPRRSVPLSNRAKEEKRHRILQAAIAVFARKGFFHARISEIAHEAGVADGTIYLYFENKDHLLIAVFEEEMQAIIGRFREALAPVADPAERLRGFVRMHAEMVIENPDLAHVLQVELRQSSTFMSDYKPVRFQEFLDILESIILEGRAAGVFRQDIHPGTVKRAVFGALDELALHWIMRDRRYDLRASSAELADLFIHGIRSKPDASPARPTPHERGGAR